MHVSTLSWRQLESVLAEEDRAVLPLGSTEQHAHLSLCTDAILAERMAVEAAEPLGVPVFPVLPYGITPYFTGYPGTVSLRVETYVRLLTDILDNLARMGARRILLVNGHGGNAPGGAAATEWAAANDSCRVKTHNWWKAPETRAKLVEIDPVGSHASWAENFPWTRVPGSDPPQEPSPLADRVRMSTLSPREVREYLGSGNMGGLAQRPDEEVLELWATGVAETREQLEGPWG